MKFLFPISALVFLGSAVTATVKPDHNVGAKMLNAKKLKLEQDFMRAIHADGKIASAQRKKREQDRKRKLYQRLMDAAIPKEDYDKKRKLEEYDMGDSYEWMNPVYQQMVEDGVFDLTARSFKYSGCAAIKAFDPDRAANTGNPMTVDTYAVFRLCPEDSCNKYSLTGCGKNYGEYVVEMSTYLEFMLDFYADHYGAYCDYCYSCDYNYQVMKKQTQGECYEAMNQADYQIEQEQQQMAWGDYYQQNFGDMSEYMQQKQQYQQQMQQQMNSAEQNYNVNNANNANAYQQGGNGNSYNANGNNDGYNRKLDGGYYSDFAAYTQGDSSGSYDGSYGGYNGSYGGYNQAAQNDGYANGQNQYAQQNAAYTNNQNSQSSSNLYGWINGGQVSGQSYYNMMNQQMQMQDGQPIYGYVNENGEFVDLCDSNGYTDENGKTYNINCDAYESKMMVCSDGSLCDYCEYQVDLNFEPCDEYVCKDYYTYCSDLYEPQYKQMYNDGNNNNNNNNNNGGGNYNYNWNYGGGGGGGGGQSQYSYQEAQQQKDDLYQFLDCTEYVNEYGQQYFVGPHCGSDHYTISLGVFSDENCVNYLGETVSLSKVLGYGYSDESFFHLPHECISCDGAQQFEDDQDRYQEMYMGQGVYGDYVEAPNEEFDDVVGMCAALFERSAQCNIHMNNYDMMSKYMETIDASFEQRYCAFIDNIVYGTYDEMGEIKLRSDTFDFNDWRNPDQYKKMKMPAGQAIGLALSILLVIALSALAFITQRSLTRRGTPWRPRRFKKSVEVSQGPANPTPPLI